MLGKLGRGGRYHRYLIITYPSWVYVTVPYVHSSIVANFPIN